ncbi:MAG: BrnT family toxin [Melioribacteraceae bacterium]
MGIASNGILVVVIHTFEEDNSSSVTVRIISARKANKKETKQY